MNGRLRDHEFQISYGPGDDRLHGLYIPALERSVSYDRSAGYFSSASLAIVAAGIARLIQNGGKMRLLVGADLSEEDVAAIAAGHDLAEKVANLYLTRLPDPEDALLHQRLEALAWMVADGTLEIRVVLPVGADGVPLAADQTEDYYHPKEGIFTDSTGDKLAFSGSVNESIKAWRHNYETLMVFRSWDSTRPYVALAVQRFERLWKGDEPDWIALPIPEAVRQRLIQFRPTRAPKVDPLELVPKPPPKPRTKIEDEKGAYECATDRERLVVQFVRDAPYLPNARRLGAATSAVAPWPNQSRVADAIVDRFPERFLIADEVGLGKTIEAGLIIRQLLISGRVRRCLILTPKTVLPQWQEELYEKFALEVPRYDGAKFLTVFDEELPPTTDNPFDGVPVALASSQLVKRKERQQQLLTALPWDLVVVDEAHHARRRDFLTDRYRPNRLLELLSDLKSRTRGLLLLTATPMQVHPVEVWDLLRLLGLGGRWGADQENFLRYFGELRKPFDDADWNFVFDMVGDYLATGGTVDRAFAQTAEQKIGIVDWQQVESLPRSKKRDQVLKHLSPQAIAVAVEFAKRHTPLRRFVFRNTRALLRKYRERGILKDSVPRRDPRLDWITMNAVEWDLYERIEEYITEFYAKYENERKGLGFIMTVYRRRLTSSFYAIERSLQRRLKYLKGLTKDMGLDDDDLEEADLDEDVTETLSEASRDLCKGEVAYVEDFLSELHNLMTDTKLEWLRQDLLEILKQRETVLLFMAYTDTMDYLRDKLRQVYGSQVACYSGRGGEEWREGKWVRTTKEEMKNTFREGKRVKILLCTEAASEGLNLQTCGALINYDMPWNPMRVEQRIGRIDRIGQIYPIVWLRNYFYEDTIEAKVYQRLSDRIDWFTTVVGDLQPILSRVAKSIQTLAMLPGSERQRRLDQEIAELHAELEQKQMAFFSLDDYVDEDVTMPAKDVPLTLPDIERIVTNAGPLRDRFKPHPQIEGAYLLSWSDSLVPVTFDRQVFDDHPDTVRFITYGERLLDELLALVEPPTLSDGQGGVLHLGVASPVPLRCYYRPADGRAKPVGHLTELEAVITQTEPLVWDADRQREAEEHFQGQIDTIKREDDAVAQALRRSEYLALVERGRQVLLRTALLELTLGQRPTLFDQALPYEFSEQAVLGLRRHKYPFAPLLHLVGADGIVPSPTDRYYLSLSDKSDQSLRQLFDQLKEQAGDLVPKLVSSIQHCDAFAVQPSSVDAAFLEIADSERQGSALGIVSGFDVKVS